MVYKLCFPETAVWSCLRSWVGPGREAAETGGGCRTPGPLCQDREALL